MSLISDKFTPIVTRESFTPLGYSRRMKYMMNTKELARLTVIKGAIEDARLLAETGYSLSDRERGLGKVFTRDRV
jgi:hypothetical protein